jgi:hypothetical protein
MVNSLFDVLFCVMILYSIVSIANTPGGTRIPWFKSGLGGSLAAYAMYVVIYIGTVHTSSDENVVAALRAIALCVCAMLISLASHCNAKFKANPSRDTGPPAHGEARP